MTPLHKIIRLSYIEFALVLKIDVIVLYFVLE